MMKQLVLTLCLLFATGQAAMAQQVKLGHIDRQKLLLTLPERKGAEEKMQAFAKTLDERLKAMGAEYQAKVADAQARADKMTQTEKEMAVREINELEQRIQTAQEKAQEDLAKQEEELLKPMVERTNQAIKDVADEKGFTYIFDISTGFVLYFDKGEDIMPLVKAKLGIQ
ncbi:MAG: OmpH family outer membrane protein [Flavobacteriales bacterium]|nr:MAG: OmpH family outer membrane protein [Flavobacteriales bacterium]